jgi:glutathione S-transferase
MPLIQYFPSRGRAEPVRLCYALKGVGWSEEHVGGAQLSREDMHTSKEAFPYGQVPRLVDDDGTAIVQSLAILRYVARKL